MPCITSPSIVGFVALLRERGHWPAVREEVVRRDPFASRWIDRIADGTWCPLERGIGVIEAAEALLGPDSVRELGFSRFSRSMDTGVLAPMLRSWARSVGPDTTTLMRLTPHLWRAASQGLGEMRVLDVHDGHAHFTFTSEHPLFVTRTAWHRFLEGFTLGLLALRHGDGVEAASRDEAVMTSDGAHVELVVRWTP